MESEEKDKFRHLGFKIPADLHYRVKNMSLVTGKSITELMTPMVKGMIEDWEKSQNEKN